MSNSLAAKFAKWVEAFRRETDQLHPKLQSLFLASALLPRRNAGEKRASLYRLVGFRIGQGTVIEGGQRITGDLGLFANLIVGSHCQLDADCVLDLEERITLGDSVTVGPGVMILTSTHELASKERRAGPVVRSPVTIGKGAWLGARSTILPGLTVGEGAIVNPGAVVTKDVAPHTRVGGSPAVQIEVLAGTGHEEA